MYDKAYIDNLLVKIANESNKLIKELNNSTERINKREYVSGKEVLKSFSFNGKAIMVTPGDYYYKYKMGDGCVPVSYLQKCIDSHSKDNESRVYERIMRIDSPFR